MDADAPPGGVRSDPEPSVLLVGIFFGCTGRTNFGVERGWRRLNPVSLPRRIYALGRSHSEAALRPLTAESRHARKRHAFNFGHTVEGEDRTRNLADGIDWVPAELLADWGGITR